MLVFVLLLMMGITFRNFHVLGNTFAKLGPPFVFLNYSYLQCVFLTLKQ